MSDIYLQITETPTVVTLSSPVISGALSSTVTVANTVTVALDASSLSALENVTVTVGAAITGTVTVSNSVTIGSLPAISGTVTANTFTNLDWIYVSGNFTYTSVNGTTPTLYLNTYFKRTGATQWSSFNYNSTEEKCTATITQAGQGQQDGFWALNVSYDGLSGDVSSAGGTLATYSFAPPSIYSEIPPKTGWSINTAEGFSGSVTVLYEQPNIIPISGTVTIGSAIPAGTNQIGSVTASISGTVPISISSVTVGNSVTIGSLPAISGTVTASSSNGSLTTRFGSVTTANTAFATSAVTNANRKYLLIQNVTTASNVITIGIGFTPTTTQGIQLSSGAGLTFEGSYIPTGAVNLLSSVTASCFTILEA
jgi:hypothetical protein